MCNDCCKEFKGWFKSFTKTEVVLSILEGILLVLVFVFLVFLIRHFLACKPDETFSDDIYCTLAATTTTTTMHTLHTSTTTLKSTVVFNTLFSLAPSSECTWKPSKKTKAYTKYYMHNNTAYKPSKSHMTTKFKTTIYYGTHGGDSEREMRLPDIIVMDTTDTRPDYQYSNEKPISIGIKAVTEEPVTIQLMNEYSDESDFEQDESDGEKAEDYYQQYVLALVKVNPPKDITFGCILTIVTEYWVITSASCIESIEEVDTLDAFVIIEDYGKLRKGRTHTISDVQIHPMFEGVNKSYDIAALRSTDNLMKGLGYAVDLPILVDYFMVTVGERFTLLGYGPFRTIDSGPDGRRLHKVGVYSLPGQQCGEGGGGGEGAWLRHLLPGAAVRPARCARAALCAGVLWARGTACNYCAGAPLLRGSVLFGVMSDNQQCGVACEPQLYVNIAVLRDWLDYVTAK